MVAAEFIEYIGQTPGEKTTMYRVRDNPVVGASTPISAGPEHQRRNRELTRDATILARCLARTAMVGVTPLPVHATWPIGQVLAIFRGIGHLRVDPTGV